MLFELFAELLARDRFWMVGEYLLPLCLAKPGLEVKVLFVNAMEDGGAPEKVCVAGLHLRGENCIFPKST